jgi:hypothetical protein
MMKRGTCTAVESEKNGEVVLQVYLVPVVQNIHSRIYAIVEAQSTILEIPQLP